MRVGFTFVCVGAHVRLHARVHVHMFMFSIGPVAKCSLHTESVLMPTSLVSHRTSADSSF